MLILQICLKFFSVDNHTFKLCKDLIYDFLLYRMQSMISKVKHFLSLEMIPSTSADAFMQFFLSGKD